ncbi:GIY-YIG nuclease family protein [Paenibacillus sacheonensis]|uniref:GIY-YIG nuclease family protein n=1 Tax=Paenibacillus sacheonensis TaxID=742054 RepID=A0A7X4YL06_9BACL|nr:GIY-YIG nuclease family protein [Paenibacillus sacheonensis]MBM7563130.1 hypothetical protein [Paenibacillus sacheonensis]NBC68306.1 GIY-YIG nuclease family protein [Paenibacillus sacheonensis]
MDKGKRKELLENFKEIKTLMGIIQIRNKANGKIFIDAYPNLKNKWLTLQMQLNTGRFANAQLQKDWKEFGAEGFDYEVLEEKDAGEIADVKWEMKQLEKKWRERLQPYGDQGYHKPGDR